MSTPMIATSERRQRRDHITYDICTVHLHLALELHARVHLLHHGLSSVPVPVPVPVPVTRCIYSRHLNFRFDSDACNSTQHNTPPATGVEVNRQQT